MVFSLSCRVRSHTAVSTAVGPGPSHLVAQLSSPREITPDSQKILSSNSCTETVPDPQSIFASNCFRTGALWSVCFGELWWICHQLGD